MKHFTVDPHTIYNRADLDATLRECGTSLDAILDKAGMTKTAFRFSILGSELLEALDRAKSLATSPTSHDSAFVPCHTQPTPIRGGKRAPRPLSLIREMVKGDGTSATDGRGRG
jgi:hypothetical protein